jgi:hypothetical protein
VNDILRRALEEDAADTPDPVATLAGVRHGIRRATARRRLTIAGAGVLVVATAAGVPALAARHSGTSTLSPTATPSGAFDPLRVPFRLTYIPPGWSPLVAASADFTSVGLTLSSPGSPQAVSVSLTLIDPVHPTAPPPSPGTETLYNEINRDLDPTHRLTVYAHDPQVDHATLQRIADGVDLRGSTPVTFPFRLTYLPADAGGPSVTTSYATADPTGAGGVAWQVALTLNPGPLPRPGDDGTLAIQADSRTDPKAYGQADTTFGGHRASVTTLHRKHEVDILRVTLFDVIPRRRMLLMIPVNGPISRTELAKIAAGIRPVANPDKVSTWTSHPVPQG